MRNPLSPSWAAGLVILSWFLPALFLPLVFVSLAIAIAVFVIAIVAVVRGRLIAGICLIALCLFSVMIIPATILAKLQLGQQKRQQEIEHALAAHRVIIGMTMDQVVRSLGSPMSVDYGGVGNEEWNYGQGVRVRFEKGVVVQEPADQH
jgi:hypothetical protein